MVAEVKAYIIGVLVLALVGCGLWYRSHLIDEGKANVEAAIVTTSNALIAERTKELAEQKIEDLAAIQLVEKTYATALVNSNVAVDDLNGKLRAYAAASRRGLALPGDPATSAGPDDAPRISPSVEAAIEGVDRAAGHDGAKVTGLQNYITKECH